MVEKNFCDLSVECIIVDEIELLFFARFLKEEILIKTSVPSSNMDSMF